MKTYTKVYEKFLVVSKENKGLGLSEEAVIEAFKNTNDLEELKKIVEQAEDRLYISWASVDITDRDNERIPIEDVINFQDILLKRNGPITDSHTNRVVGQTLAYKVMEHPVSKTLGVLHLNKIFSDTSMDDKIWSEILDKKRTGSSVGGLSQTKTTEIDPNTGMYRTVLGDFQQYETATVFKPANPLALNEAISVVAKSSKELMSADEIQKPFAGYDNFAACVMANCDFLYNQIEKAEESFKKKPCKKEESTEIVLNKFSNEIVKEHDSLKNGGVEMEEMVKKEDFEAVKKELEVLKEKLEGLVSKKEEEMKPEDKPEETMEEKEAPNTDMSGKEIPEEGSQAVDQNVQDTYKEETKKELDAVKKELAEIKKSFVVAKSEAPRPSQEVKKGFSAADLALGKVKKSWREINNL